MEREDNFDYNDKEVWDNSPVTSSDEYEDRGDPISNRESFVSELFETNERLERIKHRWRGDVEVNGVWVQKFEPLASDSFINKQISAIEGVIDKVNSFSKKNDKECKRILHDAVKAFILDAVNDESVSDKNMRTMSKTFEHTIELFLGLVDFGNGSVVLSNTVAGLGLKQHEGNKNSGGVLQWLQGKANK